MLLYLTSKAFSASEHRLIFQEAPRKIEAEGSKKAAEKAKVEAEAKEGVTPDSVTKLATERAGKEIQYTSETEKKQAEQWEKNRETLIKNINERVANGTLDPTVRDFLMDNVIDNDSIPPGVKNLGMFFYMMGQAKNKQAAAKSSEAAETPETRLNAQQKLSAATDKALAATRTPVSLRVTLSAVNAETAGLTDLSKFPVESQPALQVRKKVLESLKKRLETKSKEAEDPEKKAKADYETIKKNSEDNVKIAHDAGEKNIQSALKAKVDARAAVAPGALDPAEEKRLDEAIQKAREDAAKMEKDARADAETNLKAAETAYNKAMAEHINPVTLTQETAKSMNEGAEEQGKKMIDDARKSKDASVKSAEDNKTKLIEAATKSGGDVAKVTADADKAIAEAMNKGDEAIEKATQASKELIDATRKQGEALIKSVS